MIDWIPEIIRFIDEVKTKQLEAELAEVVERLRRVDARMDREIAAHAFRGVRHLLDAANSDLDDVKLDEYRLARSEFSALCALDANQSTVVGQHEVHNTYLILLGKWGNHHYFNVRGDKRNALLQVYESGAEYGEIALLFFPATFFSNNYPELLGRQNAQLAAHMKALEEINGENLRCEAGYYSRHALRFTTVAALGLAAALLAPVVAGGAAGGLTALWKEWKVEKPLYRTTAELKSEIAGLQKVIQGIRNDFAIECTERVDSLRKVTLSQILSMGGTPGRKARTS